MTTRTLLIAATVLSLIAMPAMAQTTKTDGGHHYSGGPKSEVPHHMGKKNVGTTTGKAKPSGSHHYSGGPRSDPHHIGPK
jgi:hypothetical protein